MPRKTISDRTLLAITARTFVLSFRAGVVVQSYAYFAMRIVEVITRADRRRDTNSARKMLFLLGYGGDYNKTCLHDHPSSQQCISISRAMRKHQDDSSAAHLECSEMVSCRGTSETV